MDIGEFWRLVDVLGGETDEEAVDRLTQILRTEGPEKARAFHGHLVRALYDLDRLSLARQPVRWLGDPEDTPPIPLSDDTFLYLRAAIVARGRAVHAEILADPAAVTRYQWDDGENLLYVAERAVGAEIDTDLSYETASNAEHWLRDGGADDVEPDDVDDGNDSFWATPGLPLLEHLGAPPVTVEIRDMLQGPCGEWVVQDDDPLASQVDDLTTFLPPTYLRMGLQLELGVELSALVGDAVQAGVDGIQVLLDVGEQTRPVPEVLAPAVRPSLLVHTLRRVLPVHVAVADTELRHMTPGGRESALRAFAAGAVLAVLPPGHAAHAVLARLASGEDTGT